MIPRFRAEAAAAADDLIARMQSSNRATAAADFQTGGVQFRSWLTNRLRAPGSGLPAASATVVFGAIGGDPNTVRIVITWTPPREAQADSGGAIASVVVIPVFSQSEAHRCSTACGADAQQAGTIASWRMMRDLRMAGSGLEHGVTLRGCRLRVWRGGVRLCCRVPARGPRRSPRSPRR